MMASGEEVALMVITIEDEERGAEAGVKGEEEVSLMEIRGMFYATTESGRKRVTDDEQEGRIGRQQQLERQMTSCASLENWSVCRYPAERGNASVIQSLVRLRTGYLEKNYKKMT